MFIDSLTLAGITAASLFLLLPLFFGKETLRVDNECREESVQETPEKVLQQQEIPDCY